jgi:hypothetical protein
MRHMTTLPGHVLGPDLLAFLADRAPDLAERLISYLPFAAPAVAAELNARAIAWRIDRRSALSRRESQEEGPWRQTTQISKENSGALLAFRDGKKVLISVDSFHRHLIERLMLNYPLDGPPKRGKRTSTTKRPAAEASPT